jgi:hypothetical protein
LNVGASFDPPGVVFVLATTDKLPPRTAADQGVVLDFKTAKEMPLFSAVVTAPTAELLLSTHINPPLPPKPSLPTIVTLDSMFDDLAPIPEDHKPRYENYKEVAVDCIHESLPSRRFYGVRRIGDESPSVFDIPIGRAKSPVRSTPVKVDPGKKGGRSVKASPLVTPSKRSRPKERTPHSSDESVGSLEDFVVSDDQVAEELYGDRFRIVEKGTKKDRKTKKRKVDEEEAHSDMYSVSETGSETDEPVAEEEELDFDFVPRKKSSPTLLGMELR